MNARGLAMMVLLCGVAHAQQQSVRPGIHFSPAENLEHIDVALLARAKTSIDIAAYVLTDIPVIDALAAAARRGVAVRLYRDGGGREPGLQVRGALAGLFTSGVAQKTKPRGPFMHLKGYVVDAEFLRSGAANFTASGLKRQDNDLIVITDPAQIAAFQTAFEAMWRR